VEDPVRLRDLVARAELGLSVATAPGPALDEPVLRPYVTDLPDPSRFLRAGDLVLTSCLWYRDAADSARFADALADAGARGLVVGLLVTRAVPAGLAQACARRGLPLIVIDERRSFSAVCEAVLAETLPAPASAIARAAGFHRRLLEAVGPEDGVPRALAAFAEEFGMACWVLTPTGRVGGAAGNPPDETAVSAVRRAVLPGRAGRHTVLVDAAPWSVWSIPDGPGSPHGHLVHPGRPEELDTTVAEALRSLHGVLTIQLELAAQRRAAARAAVGRLVALLDADAAAPGEVSAHLRVLGADPRLPTVAVVATIVAPAGIGERESGATALALLEELLAAPGRHLLGAVDEGADGVLLVNGAPAQADELVRAMHAAAGSWRSLLRDHRLLVGVSEAATSVSALSSALETARRRRESAAESAPGEPVHVVSGAKVDSHRALLSAVPARLRRTFGRQLLAPLVDYDALHGSDLVGTAASFLNSCGSWQRSAEELHVHVNTLRYRIARIEQLTGRSMSSMHDRVDLYLALSCQEEGSAG
jgi:sugar diacid utilization regulator